jgi:hypothetical protein
VRQDAMARLPLSVLGPAHKGVAILRSSSPLLTDVIHLQGRIEPDEAATSQRECLSKVSAEGRMRVLCGKSSLEARAYVTAPEDARAVSELYLHIPVFRRRNE